VSQQQTADDVSVDEIPIDTSTTQSGEIEPADVPAEIESITRGLASEQPRRTHWSSSRRLAGGIFMEKVELIPRFSGLSSGCDIATDTPSDVERFDAFLEYLVTVGFADETESLR